MWLKNEIHKVLKRGLSIVEEHEQDLRETFKKYKEDKEQEQQMIVRIRIEDLSEKQLYIYKLITIFVNNAIYRCTGSIYIPHLTAAHGVCALRALVCIVVAASCLHRHIYISCHMPSQE